MLCLLVSALLPAAAVGEPSTKPFEIIPGSFHFTPSDTQAGSHGDLTTEFDFAHNGAGHTFNDVRTIVTELPAGFVGNSTAVPTCTFNKLLAKASRAEEERALPPHTELMSQCPPDSQVGTVTFDAVGLNVAAPIDRETYPLYNMETTSYGVTAELGFKTGYLTQALTVSVRPGDSGLTVTVPNIEQLAEAHAMSVTIWGVPNSNAHDAERGLECLTLSGGGRPNPNGGPGCFNGGEKVSVPVRPYLGTPTSCGTFTAKIRADSWENPQEWTSAESTTEPITGCERLHFDPSVQATPTTNMAESSSGLNVSMLIGQTWSDPFSLATSTLRDTRVTLPLGYTVNPSAGSGLVGCTPAQYEAETYSSPPGAGCPAESKLGKVQIETPLLAEPIKGNLYLASPYDNKPEFGTPAHPGGSLLAMYVVGKAPDRGIIIKAAGKIEPDPLTGQLTTTFTATPQQPFEKLSLELKQGATSPLVSPPACGLYTILAQLTPWSAPSEPRISFDSFPIESGIGGGPCPTGGIPPFKPQVISGTQNNAAGNYTPFYLRIVRNDGEQEIAKFTTIFPPGLTGNLTGIPFCSDSAIEAARQRTGQQELSAPSCPAASEIGHTLVGAGVGSVLAWTPGKVYLAGPYHGSALSIVSVTSATVGPFDLGTVVIRFALKINPVTGQAEIDGSSSDPIPHIIDGIVVHVRDIHVYVDRSKFMIDPTSCEHMSIQNAITGAGVNIASTADDQTVNVTSPFQAADCANLAFKPLFKVTTSAHTSRTQGASLDTKVTYPANSLGTAANIRSVKVDLPRQLPSRLTTLQKACTDKQFEANPAGCPVASRVGTVVVHTPIVPVPLTGPAYFVSHGAAKFPELIVVLQGYGITIYLHGETFISKKGTTSTTFRSVPDEPFESFELNLPQGPYSALTNNGNLCNAKQVITKTKRVKRKVKGHVKYVKVHKTVKGLLMPTALTAQNGMVIHETNVIGVTGCPKAHKKAKHKKKGKKKR